jgi:hypothetical protein
LVERFAAVDFAALDLRVDFDRAAVLFALGPEPFDEPLPAFLRGLRGVDLLVAITRPLLIGKAASQAPDTRFHRR